MTVNERQWLAERFEDLRPHLRTVAYRMLGSIGEADDAIQECWLRLDRSEAQDVIDLRAWLTTVVGRICLDMLRARAARLERAAGDHVPEPIVTNDPEGDPETEAVLAESVGLALLVVLDTLTPAERLAFVLHDSFGVPFDEVADMIGRTPIAARQLASRARRRVRASVPSPDPDVTAQRRVVDAFLAASRSGDFDALIEVLDPGVVFRRHATPQVPAVVGAAAVAREVLARGTRLAPFARPMIVNGSAGVVVEVGGRSIAVVGFTVSGGRIVTIDLVASRRSYEQIAKE